jgi:O-antigen/teichoic acid export membrane protein
MVVGANDSLQDLHRLSMLVNLQFARSVKTTLSRATPRFPALVQVRLSRPPTTLTLSRRLSEALARLRAPTWTARAVGASLWTVAGSGGGQLLRLAASLITTRLLAKEAFGLMVLVNTVMQGLKMFSDLGIGPSVIRDPRGDDPTFLRTAWTLQALRGIALAAVAVAIAWPVASFYEDARLRSFVPAIGLQTAIAGFSSASLFVLQRRLQFRERVMLELGAQVVAVVVTIAWAWVNPTPWALVAGAFAEAIVTVVVSHRFEPRLGWRPLLDRDCARSVVRFGSWIFFATASSFFANRFDRLLLGKAFPTKELLGVYFFAVTWSGFLVETTRDLSGRVLFPLYSRWSDDGTAGMRSRIERARVALGAVYVPALLLLTLGGSWLMGLLYGDRYREAGPMLRLLAAGSIAACAATTVDSVLLAVGDSARYCLWQFGRFAITAACTWGGLVVGGADGFVRGAAWSNVAVYPLLALLVWPRRLGTARLDLLLVAVSSVALLLLR